jgi:hypothetical protein
MGTTPDIEAARELLRQLKGALGACKGERFVVLTEAQLAILAKALS